MSTNLEITNSSFLGFNALLTFGGVVYMQNSNLNVQGSTFAFNQANQGGVVYFGCSQCNCKFLNVSATYCSHNYTNCTFIFNSALIQGGCIAYDKYKPLTLANSSFANNSAPYGSEVAGYPFGVKVVSYDNDGVASGQPYNGSIQVEVIDAGLQRITNDNSTNIVIGILSTNTSITGKV